MYYKLKNPTIKTITMKHVTHYGKSNIQHKYLFSAVFFYFNGSLK